MAKFILAIFLVCTVEALEYTKTYIPKRACEAGVTVDCDCGGYGECPKKTHCQIGVYKDICVLDDAITVNECAKSKVDMYGRQLELCSCEGRICGGSQMCFGLPQKQRCVFDMASDEKIIPFEKLPPCTESLVQNNKRCNCRNQGECPFKTHCSSNGEERCITRMPIKKCNESSAEDLLHNPCFCGAYGFCPYDYSCDYAFGVGECVFDENGFSFDDEFDDEIYELK